MFIAERLISLVAPHNCLSCGREGSLLCAWCSNESLKTVPSRCYKCSKLTENFAVCSSHRHLSPLKHVWVTSEYEGVTKDLVHALKFSRASAAAETIAELLDSALPHYKDETIITYLPTANVRARQRGYDQSRLIAKAFANKRQLRFKETLARLGKTRQVGAKRDKRIEQVKNSYVSARPLNGLRVLLIDDVVTTGASLEAAAKVLRQAGAKEVNAAVFARAN